MPFALSLLICFAAAALLGAVLNMIGLRSWRRIPQAHWTERARVLWPLRVFVAQQLLFVPLSIYLFHVFSGRDSAAVWAPRALAGLFGAILATYPVDRLLFPFVSFREWLREVGASWTLRLMHLLILGSGIFLMPVEIEAKMGVIAAGVFVALLAWHLGLGLWLARLFGIVIAPDERLHRLVLEIAARFAVTPPRCAIVRGTSLNAFAFPLQRKILVSERLLREFSDAEVTAVLAHEMGHLGEPPIVLAGRVVLGFSLFPLIFILPALNVNPSFGLLIVGGAILLISRLARILVHRMEVRADALAHANADAAAYAQALERLYQLNHLPAVMPGKGRTHPHLYDRLIAAGVQPAYERPRPPSRMPWMGILFGALFGVGLAVSALQHYHETSAEIESLEDEDEAQDEGSADLMQEPASDRQNAPQGRQ